MAVNDAILDAQVSHAVGLQRLGTGILRRILALLNRTDADLVEQIRTRLDGVAPGTFDTEFTTERLKGLLDAIRALNADVYARIQAVLLREGLDLAAYEAAYQTRILTEHVPVRLDIVQPTAEQLQAIVMKRPFQGRLLRDWAQGLEQGRTQKVHDAIRIGMVEGETVDQIVRRVRGTQALGYKDGVLEIARRDAEAVVRTAVTHIASGASEAVYQRNADLISGVRWVSVLDSRTTPVCRARDGKVYEPGQGPRPPAHWNCRSTTTPVTRSFRELGLDLDEVDAGTRASMDGQVPAGLTYGGWLAKQPAAFQDEVLGKAKGLLFRKGGLTIDRFVDRSGHAYTLDELRRREAGAFRRAGLAA
ncbi:minor capsid protein [Methylobacterium sp. B1]|uniref:minor capsid protein n=1 Tax=Methylobacterium sp. B1 TaxID=91459 RepID=UPI0005BA5CA6|nr:minor capsid protein [Methylobacterium sp. B1]